MKPKIVLFFILFNYLSFNNLKAIEWESNLSLNVGKRFVDTFERRWPNLRRNSTDFIPATHQKLEPPRDLPSVQALFLVSPFYRHFLGIGLYYFNTADWISQRFQLNNQTHFWQMRLAGYAPLIHYRFYPQGKEKDLYFSVSTGIVLANMKLRYRSPNENIDAVLDRIRGPLLEVAMGYVFSMAEKIGLVAELALQIQRLDELEGSYQQSGTKRYFELKHNKSYMTLVEPTHQNNFAKWENSVLWNSQLKIGLGVTYRFAN